MKLSKRLRRQFKCAPLMTLAQRADFDVRVAAARQRMIDFMRVLIG